MLVDMASQPSQLENVRLSNNLGYLGDQAPTIQIGSKPASQQAQDWINTLTNATNTIVPLLSKKPKDPKMPSSSRFNPERADGGADWTTILLVGGAVVLGGYLVYRLSRKKKK